MAAAQPITDEFLKCPICLEFYIDPKYLPCLHTFCRTCIQSYITSSLKGKILETKTKVEFACPICRAVVDSKPTEDRKIEEWANLFPSNQTIASVLDNQKLQSNVKLCDPCLSEEVENPAKTWCKVCSGAFCDDCTKYHRKMPISKSHKLVLLSDMGVNDMNITRLEFCDVHKDEMVRAFCKDHEKACCVTCVTIEHRKCDEVTSLEVAAEGIKGKPETQDFLKHLRDSENTVSQMLQISKRNVDDLETGKTTLLKEVTSFRKLVDKHLNELEVKLKEKISSEHKKSMLERNDYISNLESKYATIMNYRKTLEACLQKASDVHAFLELKKIMTKSKLLDKELGICAHDMKEVRVELTLMPDVQKLLSLPDLGTIQARSTAPGISLKCIHSNFFVKSNVKLISTYQFPKLIQSATFLSNGKIVLAMVNSVVWYDENGQTERTTSVTGSSRLNDVTALTLNEILLSRTSRPLVYKLDTCSKMRNIWKDIFYCHNIVNTGKVIVAACESNIAVLDYNGKEIKTIGVRGSNIHHIAFHSETVYYTVTKEDVVRAVSLEGEMRCFEYSNPSLKEPRGIDTDSMGVIYVAGYASLNVHQISKNGHLIKIILSDADGISYPDVVCLSKTGNRLLVSHSGTRVNVYELY